ncbi:MAG: Gx transporter family protein [Clostridia bacterium]|nr:Gx transporter family protein [Clostridia bacterium]
MPFLDKNNASAPSPCKAASRQITTQEHPAQRTHPKANTLAYTGLLLCLALIFSYLETQIPLLVVPIPGIKLGFANLVITFCAYICGLKTAFFISVTRVLLTALLFGGWSGFWFSLCGALCAFCVLALMLRFVRDAVSPIGVSVACAAAHNAGQLCAASLLLKSGAVFTYFPWLLLAGMGIGTVTGTLVTLLLHFVPSSVKLAFQKGTQ